MILHQLQFDFQKRILYIFQTRILEISGFKPHLTSCIKCATEIQRQALFSIKLGGFLCPGCGGYDRFAKHISGELTSALKYIQNNTVPVSARLRLSADTELEIFQILEEFLGYHLNTRLKSLSSVNIF